MSEATALQCIQCPHRGKDWKIQLDLDQPKYEKVNRDFFIEHFERLTSILNGV